MKHVLSLGAGVQSSTMALMAAHGEITPMPDCAIFADTQAEPQSVYDYLDWLEGELPFPVYRVSYGNLTKDCLEPKRRQKDTPNGKKGRLRKDRYSALLIANMAARSIIRATPATQYNLIGGTSKTLGKGNDGKMYNGPDWYTSNVNQNICMGIKRKN